MRLNQCVTVLICTILCDSVVYDTGLIGSYYEFHTVWFIPFKNHVVVQYVTVDYTRQSRVHSFTIPIIAYRDSF